MAEARSEEEEENTMRDSREQVVRRQPNTSGGRPDRRKPEHRHSQGPLSSIRAAIKRTSTRSPAVSETHRDRDRDRDRDRERDRDRRRPEITILSAEPLASTSWFPGASGGFPPPPPPAAQIWGPTIPPAIQPPPSYEEVIKEKTQEQVLLPSSTASSSSSSSAPPTRPVSTITIATQTDCGSAPDPPEVRRPVRPPRPPLPCPPKPCHVDNVSTGQSTLSSPDSVAPNTDLLAECLTSTSGAQTDQWDPGFTTADAALPSAASSHAQLERPKPRPRSKLGVRPVSCEVKVQTLVKLREDGLATLASRAGSDGAESQGKYLQELLEAFSSDDWGFPDHRSDSSGLSQSESEEEEDEEDMATLRARIQAFEQQQQQVADENCGDGNKRPSGAAEGFVEAKKPEPRPRPRIQGQPAKSVPPVVAPKPKNFSQGPKPSTKGFWEDGGLTSESSGADAAETEINSKAETASEPPASSSTKPAPSVSSVTPKPQPSSETPVPAPRPPPPKLTSPPTNPKPPPRPAVVPRASMGAPQQDKGTADGRTTPTLPPRPSVEVSGGAQTESGAEASHGTTNQPVKAGSVRPCLPTKPAALTSPRRASAPNLGPKPAGGSATPSDPNTTATITAAPKPLGPAPTRPPTLTPAPAPAVRKGPKAESTSSAASSEPPLPPRPSSVKLLPLRPPPIKSIPERPPPPIINSSATQIAPPTKTAPSVSSQRASPPPASVASAQRAQKRGPPLPPRPKPGHPLYNNHMKQEVLIVLDDPSPSEPPAAEERAHIAVNPSQCLLDVDTEPEPVLDRDRQSKPALEGLNLSDSQSILPAQPAEHKEQPDPPTVSGPRCVALFDYEGEEDDELTFSQGDVIALLELIGPEWGRGQIHGRIGIFPLNFTEVVEPLPAQAPGPEPADTPLIETPKTPQDSQAEEWVVALFDFPGQTAEDLSFQKGALIRVMEHIDAEWCRGRLEGREGLYPAAFTDPCQSQPIPSVQSADSSAVAKALFEFTAESEDELTVKVGDIITQVESVDEQWIFGVVGGKRGIVPKNYISLF